ncbi:MAG: FG-GAP-like repeat-containing protein [Phycisphaerales bacterium]
MKSTGLVAALAVSGVASAQSPVCIENICFVDHGASGQIDLGPRFGSLSVIDYDRDGYPDLVVRDSTTFLARLYHNIPDPLGLGARTFVDVTESSGLAEYAGVGVTPEGAHVADFDNDGWSDLYLSGLRGGDPTSGRLYRNVGGAFIDVTASAGVAAAGDEPESASWVDFDLDGNVDLMIASRTGSAHPLLLLRNRGDGTFEDASQILPAFAGWSRMYAHTWTDIDGDGYPDMLGIPTSGPLLLRNLSDGAGGRVFVEAALASGFDLLGPAPMGISAGDYDNDGDFDFGLSNGEVGVYYENDAGQFTRRPLLTSIFAWGILWVDVNNDGWVDHYQAGSAGRAQNHNILFINRGGGVFEDISPALNDLLVSSQHAVQVDYNNDGRMDLVTINPYNTPTFVSVSENVSTTGNHWLKVHARGDGVRVNRDAIGAIVRVTAGGVTQSREIASGSSTNSNDDLRAHFGLGASSAVERIEIVWPRVGTIESRTDVYPGPYAGEQILELLPRCPADFNGSGDVTSQDFFDYLVAFLNGEPIADADRDGTVTSADFFVFLGEFFGGCG